MRKYATYEIIHVNCDYSEKLWSVCSSPYGFSLTLEDFQPGQLMPCFCFQVVKKNLDYVRILRRNNWIVRSQKFRISDGWVQNLTTVPGKDGSVQNKTNRSEFGHIHLIFDTFVQYSDSVVPFRTIPSNFGLFRFVWDNSQISCSTVPF